VAVSYNLDKAKDFFSLTVEGFSPGRTTLIQGIGSMGIRHLIKVRAMGGGNIIPVD